MTTASKRRRAPVTVITVDKDVAAQAVEQSSSHCMIAEAVKAALPDARYVSVDLQTIRYSDPRVGLRYIYLTPRRVQEALTHFDMGVLPQESFSFRLVSGHVTRSGDGKVRHVAKTPEEQAKIEARREELRQAKIIDRENRQAESRRASTFEVEGGPTPPRGALAHGGVVPSRRRQFGMRALERSVEQKIPGETLLHRHNQAEM